MQIFQRCLSLAIIAILSIGIDAFVRPSSLAPSPHLPEAMIQWASQNKPSPELQQWRGDQKPEPKMRRSSEQERREREGYSEEVNLKTTATLVGGQSFLIVAGLALGALIKTPSYGFGPFFLLDVVAWKLGVLGTLPLGLFAWATDFVEDKFPALQAVSKATQRSVLALMGGRWRPLFALGVSTLLGIAAGLGEELVFRGILQYELGERIGEEAVAIGITSVIFGLLHAVTPLYAVLATVASVYFGFLYMQTQNLAVPIICHGLYDLGALMAAHWQVSQLSASERRDIAEWNPNEPPM